MFLSSYNQISTATLITVITFILSIAASVVTMVLIVPKGKREKLPKGLQIIHDICNFKGLLLEIILKALYIFATVYVFLSGFFTLFSGGYNYGLTLLVAILTMVLGPIVVRIFYELLIMFVLLVKNVIQINNKLKDNSDSDSENPFEIKLPKKENPQPFMQNPYQHSGYVDNQAPNSQPTYNQPINNNAFKFCANCGSKLPIDAKVCNNCGKNAD